MPKSKRKKQPRRPVIPAKYGPAVFRLTQAAHDRGRAEAVAEHSRAIADALVRAESQLRGGYTETIAREVVRLLCGDVSSLRAKVHK